MSHPMNLSEALDKVIAAFNNRIRREGRIDDPDLKVKDFIENKAEMKKALLEIFTRVQVEAAETIVDTLMKSAVADDGDTYFIKITKKSMDELKASWGNSRKE